MVIPTRRSSAEAIQLMFTHALGEAGAPYLIGVLAGVFDDNLVGKPTENPSITINITYFSLNTKLLFIGGNGTMTSTEREYFSFEYSLFVTLAFEVLGGLFFLAATGFVAGDKEKADQFAFEEFQDQEDEQGKHE